MATTYQVLLVDGPCDGRTKQLTDDQLKTHKTWCDGQLYLLQTSLATIQQPWVFEWAPAVQQKGQAVNPKSATEAWNRWMHALARTGPESHRRIVNATARARRIARH